MVEILTQLVVIGLWSAMLSVHTRRLLRLSRVEASAGSAPTMRNRLQRVWWWLGREELWRSIYRDFLRCSQLTVMVFLLVIGHLG
jgi:hypothetical protein